MCGAECFNFGLWWIFPLVMMALCFLLFRGGRGFKMCGQNFRRGGPTRNSIIGILEERYAKGEIDREEYEEKKKVLGNDESIYNG